jgi:hypothetical protein
MTSVNLTDAVNELINGTVRLVARRHGGLIGPYWKSCLYTHFCVSTRRHNPVNTTRALQMADAAD